MDPRPAHHQLSEHPPISPANVMIRYKNGSRCNYTIDLDGMGGLSRLVDDIRAGLDIGATIHVRRNQ